ncbi:hypothetical protein [Frankia sp. Cppng1_Ct_nod]|uniref:hypothetical protein n=1 Tax=Frankia sp. Cppng1_Ct_nod TaxID=2897162 RepID=UPI0010415956|nr:hypothetical protein [Frankia sp. Cppng1_Ct_nod]
MVVLRSLLTAIEELTLLLLPHGGQRTARRNAWRAAADLHVGSDQHTDTPWTVARIPPQTGVRMTVATEH